MWRPLEVEDDPLTKGTTTSSGARDIEQVPERRCCSRRIKCRLITCGVVSLLLIVLVASIALSFSHEKTLGEGPCVSECPKCRKGVRLPPSDPLPLPEPTAKGGEWNVLTRSRVQPITSDTKNDAIRVDYVPGRYGSISGADFKANPFTSLPADSAVLSYSVYFPADFPWTRGGKLPGFCIGSEPGECATGSNWAWSSGSFRMMWREGGRAIGYTYIPLQAGLINARWSAWSAQGSEYKRVASDTGNTGDDVFCKVDGGLVLKAGIWNDVTMVVAMNSPLLANGWLSMTVNEETRTVKGVRWQGIGKKMQIQSVLFATFFGGGDDSWATDEETYALFRNFSFRAPADLGASNL